MRFGFSSAASSNIDALDLLRLGGASSALGKSSVVLDASFRLELTIFVAFFSCFMVWARFMPFLGASSTAIFGCAFVGGCPLGVCGLDAAPRRGSSRRRVRVVSAASRGASRALGPAPLELSSQRSFEP